MLIVSYLFIIVYLFSPLTLGLHFELLHQFHFMLFSNFSAAAEGFVVYFSCFFFLSNFVLTVSTNPDNVYNIFVCLCGFSYELQMATFCA
jgi:hypothetical protein